MLGVAIFFGDDFSENCWTNPRAVTVDTLILQVGKTAKTQGWRPELQLRITTVNTFGFWFVFHFF